MSKNILTNWQQIFFQGSKRELLENIKQFAQEIGIKTTLSKLEDLDLMKIIYILTRKSQKFKEFLLKFPVCIGILKEDNRIILLFEVRNIPIGRSIYQKNKIEINVSLTLPSIFYYLENDLNHWLDIYIKNIFKNFKINLQVKKYTIANLLFYFPEIFKKYTIANIYNKDFFGVVYVKKEGEYHAKANIKGNIIEINVRPEDLDEFKETEEYKIIDIKLPAFKEDLSIYSQDEIIEIIKTRISRSNFS